MNTGLANLVAELEWRLTGSSTVSRLDAGVARAIPEAGTYVLALFDGLGHHQLDHPAATSLRAASRGVLDAPFPSTTTVSMSTIATGSHPISHGTIGHHVYVPALDAVVNVLKWRTPGGEPIEVDTDHWLPEPNLWERLRSAGVEPITVQPGQFTTSPLTAALYRGARFEPVYTDAERIDATIQLASVPNRLVFVYFAEVDFAAHVGGLTSAMYDSALSGAADAWSRLASRLPAGAALVGTADHGMITVDDERKLLIRDRSFDRLTFWGDPRGLMVRGDGDLVRRLVDETGASVVPRSDLVGRLGSGPRHPELELRLPDVLLEPPPRHLLLPRGMDRRLVGYHGGMTAEEIEIPLLVSG